MGKIESAWFYEKLAENGASLRDLARHMMLDPSAVSRMLNGDRKMSAEEQDSIAAFLRCSLEEVAAHRRGSADGFSEESPPAYQAQPAMTEPPVEMFTADDIVYKDGKRWMELEDGTLLELHPIFGCMGGTMTIPPGVDLTAPMDWDEAWGEKLYHE